MRLVMILPAVLLWSGCGPVEVRVGKKDGIPPLTGSSEVSLESFQCGQPIPAGDYQVTTRVVPEGCELSFENDVPVVRASDYTNIPALSGATNLLQSVELVISKLQFTDTDTNTVLVADTRFSSASFSINGQVVADKAALSALPKTVTLTGQALNSIKAHIDNREPASVHANSVVVLLIPPALPKKLKVDYDAQPTLVLGPGKISIPTK